MPPLAQLSSHDTHTRTFVYTYDTNDCPSCNVIPQAESLMSAFWGVSDIWNFSFVSLEPQYTITNIKVMKFNYSSSKFVIIQFLTLLSKQHIKFFLGYISNELVELHLRIHLNHVFKLNADSNSISYRKHVPTILT